MRHPTPTDIRYPADVPLFQKSLSHPPPGKRAALDELRSDLPFSHPGRRSSTTARMPYTPPAQLSPVVSKQTSPALSRSSSYLKAQFLSPELPPTSNRPNLPRSAGSSSYLSRHRRSPSLNDSLSEGSRPGAEHQFDPHGSLRQSPPPVNKSLIPTGLTISPPDSSHNSSDEDDDRGRSRDLDNLAELQAAISGIEQRKESSPTRKSDESKKAQSASDLVTPQTDGTASPSDGTRPPLSQEARKIAHSRSSTDSNIVFDSPQKVSPVPNYRTSSDDEDEDDDDSPTSRPMMVRKKSGELVRPALRPPSRRRPSSMPGTPTYSKAVHFDSHLEHVRHFLQVDRPLAVSAGSSPVETYESESEFPFGSDESSARPRATPFEWELRLANFPADTEDRKSWPVRVERVFLSSDNKNLIGNIAVQNLAFQKQVVARFTLDYWKTTSELVADFNSDVRRKHHDGCDRFSFSIKLADQANLENKTLFFCIRYSVNGQDYWDSNGSGNYQVDFTKKPKASLGGNERLGGRPLNTLPRSRPSPPASSGGRPRPMQTSFDDFSTGFDGFAGYGQSPAALIGEPKIKLRSPRAKAELVSDAPTRRHKPAGGPLFGHRYDFNSSLTAAKNSAYAILGEQSGLQTRPDAKQSAREVPAATVSTSASIAPSKLENGVSSVASQPAAPALASTPAASKPAALMSEKPTLTSQSYQELVDKYCFFGSARSPPSLTRDALAMVDGASDEMSVSDFSVGSPQSSGSSTPTGRRGQSPSPPSEVSSVKAGSPHVSRSSSPLPRAGSCGSSRSTSPASFGYPYHPTSLFRDNPPSTAIRG